VTRGVILLTDKRRSTTEESIGTGGNNDTLSLTLFACGPRKTLITVFLGDRKRLSSERSLIDGHVDSLSQTAVSGNDVTNLERDYVARNE
jgi:hypothetical protein